MSSTSGVQNFLVNVFRPVYTYDATATLFTPKLELSNIDTYSGNTISVFTAAVGDSNNNVYVGSNAGNPYTTTKLCRNVTAIGYGAGSNISNVSNSTFLGYQAGAGAAGATSNVAVGANASGNGTSNVYVGAGTGSAGSSNVFLGAGTTGIGTGSILIGPGLSDASTNSVFKLGQAYLYGDMGTKWLGLGTPTPYDVNNKMDISGNLYVFGQEGINMVPTRTLDVNGDFRADDAGATLDFTGGSLTVTGGFNRTLTATAVAQPIIQYGKVDVTGSTTGSAVVTLPTEYSDASYVVQATMEGTTVAKVSVDPITDTASFTVRWSEAGVLGQSIGWTTYGT
jgi:hypothetical protein